MLGFNLILIKMPIPKPQKDEEKDEFIRRCVPKLMEEDDIEKDQAVAICMKKWEEK